MNWLPDLVPLSDYGGDVPRYIEAIYGIFRRDFLSTQPIYRGRRCYCDGRPDSDGKACGFWHIITEGNVENERVPNMRRCERIAWPRAVIEAADSSLVNVWTSARRNPGRGLQERVSMAPEDFSYHVVLQPTKTAYVLVTAYHLEHQRQRDKKRKEFQAAQK